MQTGRQSLLNNGPDALRVGDPCDRSSSQVMQIAVNSDWFPSYSLLLLFLLLP